MLQRAFSRLKGYLQNKNVYIDVATTLENSYSAGNLYIFWIKKSKTTLGYAKNREFKLMFSRHFTNLKRVGKQVSGYSLWSL